MPMLKDEWVPGTTVVQILQEVARIIANPDIANPSMPDIANQYANNKAEHDRIAKQWTQKYAM